MAPRTFPLLPRYHTMAMDWLDHPGEPAPTARAATIMIVRDHPGGPGVDVFMLHRAATMRFAPNVLVFPGGGVTEHDAMPDIPWAGPTPEDWAHLLGQDVATARSLVVAACRETFEECGVLLASPDVPSATWPTHDDRAALENGHLTLAELLHRHHLTLRTDWLHPLSRWVTPHFERRRYDATFFLAHLPAGQEADDRSREAVSAQWRHAPALLHDAASGTATLLPPTLVNVEALATVTTADEAMRLPSSMEPIMPVARREGDLLVESID